MTHSFKTVTLQYQLKGFDNYYKICDVILNPIGWEAQDNDLRYQSKPLCKRDEMEEFGKYNKI